MSPYVSKRGDVEGESATRARGQNNWHNTETVDGKIELWTKLNCALWRERRESSEREPAYGYVAGGFSLKTVRTCGRERRLCCVRDEVVSHGRAPGVGCREQFLSRVLMTHALTKCLFNDPKPVLQSAVGSGNDSRLTRNSFKFNYSHLENAF